jgi:hypothetical protein
VTRPDPGQALLDEAITRLTVEQRVAWAEERRRLGVQLVWQQLDRAGLTHPIAQADFLLRRLYPEMPEQWFAEVLRQLRAKHDAGEWHGFERPRT